MLYLESLFLETGDSIALHAMVVIANYEPLPLLKLLRKAANLEEIVDSGSKQYEFVPLSSKVLNTVLDTRNFN